MLSPSGSFVETLFCSVSTCVMKMEDGERFGRYFRELNEIMVYYWQDLFSGILLGRCFSVHSDEGEIKLILSLPQSVSKLWEKILSLFPDKFTAE